MKTINVEDGLHIKNWCEDTEEGALEQAFNLAKLPFAFSHIALMPDAHQGYGMPIGGVLAAKNYIIPNAVGVDIGCGVYAAKTNLIDTERLKNILGKIRTEIPVGFKHRDNPIDNCLLVPEIYAEVCHRQILNIDKQLGTLGGGNHFIEIQKDEDGRIWFMIHSGSRNLGKTVCDFYNKKAKEINQQYFSSVSPKHDLAFFPANSKEGEAYIEDMNYCLKFAKENRRLMAELIGDAFKEEYNSFEVVASIDVHHNYAAIENHFEKNVWVHRKGATSARENQAGIIPGSQGTASYIVKGRGNPDSFNSCSHGAGRKMSRTRAIKELNLEDEKKLLEDKGILHSIRNAKDLDEASGAYKDIDDVIAAQSDLIAVVNKLEPLAVIKG